MRAHLLLNRIIGLKTTKNMNFRSFLSLLFLVGRLLLTVSYLTGTFIDDKATRVLKSGHAQSYPYRSSIGHTMFRSVSPRTKNAY